MSKHPLAIVCALAFVVGDVKKTVGGVKKAGVAIGKTFGKLGGVFHD